MNSKTFVAALVCCVSLISANEASANSWRVNYDKRANADFQDLNAAMADNRVADGDTLYMDKGCTISSQQTISKTVTVIGPGYFIGENDADEAYFSNTIFIEASGVKLTGLHTSNIEIRENDAVIERCRVTGNITATEQYENDGAQIRSCFIVGTVWGQGANGSDEWNITNNIIFKTYEGAVRNFSNALIDHNTLYLPQSNEHALYQVKESTITNNIIYNSYKDYYGSWYYDRIINTNGPQDNNIFTHNITSVSEQYRNGVIIGEGDANRQDYYLLTENSPAKGYAIDGSDCGPYAGAFPYVENGYPLYVPRFESITIPSQPDESGKLNIQMVIKNQNK